MSSNKTNLVPYKTFANLTNAKEKIVDDIENNILKTEIQNELDEKIIFLNFDTDSDEFDKYEKKNQKIEKSKIEQTDEIIEENFENENYCDAHIKNFYELLNRRLFNSEKEKAIELRKNLRKSKTKERCKKHLEERKFDQEKSNKNNLQKFETNEEILSKEEEEEITKQYEEIINRLSTELETKDGKIKTKKLEFKDKFNNIETKLKLMNKMITDNCEEIPKMLNVLNELKSENLDLIFKYLSMQYFILANKETKTEQISLNENNTEETLPTKIEKIKDETNEEVQEYDIKDLISICPDFDLDRQSPNIIEEIKQKVDERLDKENLQDFVKSKASISNDNESKLKTFMIKNKDIQKTNFDTVSFAPSISRFSEPQDSNSKFKVWTTHKTAMTDTLRMQYKEIKQKIITRKAQLKKLDEPLLKAIDLHQIAQIKYQTYRERAMYEASECEKYQRELDLLKLNVKKLNENVDQNKIPYICSENSEMIKLKNNLKEEMTTWQNFFEEKQKLHKRFQEDGRKLKKELFSSRKCIDQLERKKCFLEKRYDKICFSANARDKILNEKIKNDQRMNITKISKIRGKNENLQTTMNEVKKVHSSTTFSFKRKSNQSLLHDIDERKTQVRLLQKNITTIRHNIENLRKELNHAKKKKSTFTKKNLKPSINNTELKSEYQLFKKEFNANINIIHLKKEEIKLLESELEKKKNDFKNLLEIVPEINSMEKEIKILESTIINTKLNFRAIKDSLNAVTFRHHTFTKSKALI